MQSRFIQFRGEEQEIMFRDYGYEPDTNAHEIDWHFTDNTIEPTDAEIEEIEIMLRSREPDYEDY